MTKFFKKCKTQNIPFLAHVGPILGQNRFFLKILFSPVSFSFLFLILNKYHCTKFRKDRMNYKQRWFQTDGQMHNHKFIRPFLLMAGTQNTKSFCIFVWKTRILHKLEN